MTNGNGSGHGSGARVAALTVDDMPGHRAALAELNARGRLAYAVDIVGSLPDAERFLKALGYRQSITDGARNDQANGDGDGRHAAHEVNVPDAGWSYSAHGSPGHEDCCATRPRGLYQGTRPAGELPYVHKRVMTLEGRVLVASFVMSRTADSPRALVTYDAIDRGRVFHRLGIPASKSPRVREALTTVMLAMGYDPELPEQPNALTPSARTEDGRIPVPEWSILPPGYGDQPPGPADSPARLAARATQARIAAGSPQIALIMGASIAGPFAAATGIQSCLWELVRGAGAGKTTVMQLAAAMWGRPSLPPEPGVLASWDASAKGMGRNAGYLGTLPLFADESGTADFAPAEWARFTYGQTQGASRLTSSTDGEPRRTPGWAGFMFLSGNGTITEGVRAGKFAGIPRRVLSLQGPFTLTADECDELAAAVAADYGHIGPAALEAVTVDQFRQWQREARAELGEIAGPTLATNAAQLAAAVAGARLADVIAGAGDIGPAALAAARGYLGITSEPESDREIALRKLAEWLSSNRAAYPDRAAYEATGRPDEYVPGQPASRAGIPLHGVAPQSSGARDDEWLYVYPATWDALTAECGITGTLALADMHQRGELHVPPSLRGKYQWDTAGPRWLGRPPVYKIRLDAIKAMTGPDDDGPNDDGPRQDQPTNPAPVVDPRSEPADPGPADPLAGGWGPGTIGADANGEDHQDHAAPAPETRSTAADLSDVDDHQADDPRAAWLAESRKRTKFTSEQQAELTRITALLDENPDPADKTPLPGPKGKTALVDLTDRLQFLATMDGSREGNKGWGGPFLPTLRGRGAQLHVKRGLDAAELATIIEGYEFARSYHGSIIVADRNGAWIGSIGNAKIARGALDHTGELSLRDAKDRAGYVKVIAHPWTEADMPNPLGNVRPGTEVVISTELAGLLYDLYVEGRWPDDGAVDSWTSSEVTHLKDWGNLAREQRRYALEVHGYKSGAYQATKDAASKAISMMGGTREMGQPRSWVCKAHHPDWRHAIITNSAITIWRTLDRCRKLAAGNPDLAPIGIRAKDELLIPAAALELFTTQNYPGGTRPPVIIDQTGVTLGTFKVKGTEVRP